MTQNVQKQAEAEKARAIATAVREIELSTTDAWSELDILSSNTQVEAIEVFEDEIRQANDGKFEGPINMHVTLQYPENITMFETFPGRFEGTWKDNRPSIEKVTVDSSSFYS
jgi:hypothetical protein